MKKEAIYVSTHTIASKNMAPILLSITPDPVGYMPASRLKPPNQQ
jgi:hypothetical protein